uniref:Uncharacterized protein n=1 Tax=Arundo donax TaxID=35708 RepID=A0A0A9AT63_ARUDO
MVQARSYAIDDAAALSPAQSLFRAAFLCEEVLVQATVHHVVVDHIELPFPQAVPEWTEQVPVPQKAVL